MGIWQKIQDEKVRRSLRASDRDGLFWSVMFGFGENFIEPFAVALKATNVEMAALGSVPQFLGSLIQPFTVDLMDRLRNRKRVVLIGVVLQALVWLPLFFLPVLMRSRAVPLLILFFTLYFMLARFTAPAWVSWMGDIVPENLRGEYFGHRNTIIQIATVASTFAAGALLGLFEGRVEMLGFGAIFMVALVARLISSSYLRMMDEPAYGPLPEERFSFGEFIRTLPENTYGRFVMFHTLFRFATAFAAPFFTLYMIRDLGMSYLAFTAIIVCSTVAKVFTIQFWGRYGDRFGNMKVLAVTALLIPIVPVLWLVSGKVAWLVLLHLLAGVVWGGYDLAAANFLFDAIAPTKRARVFAYHDTLHSLMIFAGAMAGGFFSTRVPTLWNLPSNLLTIFLISGVLRLVVAVIFLPKLKEVRPVEPVTGMDLLFAYLAVEPLETMIHGAFHGARHGVRLLRKIERMGWEQVFGEDEYSSDTAGGTAGSAPPTAQPAAPQETAPREGPPKSPPGEQGEGESGRPGQP